MHEEKIACYHMYMYFANRVIKESFFFNFSEGSGSGSKDEKKVCTTVSGAAPNLPCIFPFRFNGVTHTTCIWDMAHLTEHKAWCSTLVDDSGHHVGGQGKWGNCGPDCPIPEDKRNQTKLPGRTDLLFIFKTFLKCIL